MIAAVAFPAAMVHWQPAFAGWPLRLATVMVAPAFTEELMFRGLLIPPRGESGHSGRSIAVSLVLFVLWHAVEALTFLPGAHLFLTLPFLACALILGATCAWMRYGTGSLWPAVVFHGVTVFLWQAAFGLLLTLNLPYTTPFVIVAIVFFYRLRKAYSPVPQVGEFAVPRRAPLV